MDMEEVRLIPDDGNSCIRLRGKSGNYLSLLPCGINGVDLCLPDGTVLYCGFPNELVNIFVNELGIEKIDRD